MMKSSIIAEMPERIRHHRRRHLDFKALVLLAAACTMASSIVVAGDLKEVIPWDIKAGTLDQALLQFGEEAHMQINFAWRSGTAVVRTGEIKGTYTGTQVLARLLKGTRLKYAVVGDTISIRPEAQGKAAAPSRSAARHIGLEGTPGFGESAVPTPPFRVTSTPPPAFLQEVVVTGTHIADVAPISPITSITSADIRQSGMPDIASVINSLPQVYSGGGNPDAVVSGGVNGGASNVDSSTADLRGIGALATLTLINGHRMVGSGGARSCPELGRN
jgi:iron complex outermembrane receptor protein